MCDKDLNLIKRYHNHQDEEALSEIVHRYADFVYGICHRVLGNVDQAQDMVQETFYELLKAPEKVKGSLGGWLHRVATNKSIDQIRRDTSRRKQERNYVADHISQPPEWHTLSPIVDEALNELNESMRQLLIAHYYQKRTQKSLALARGVSQPTISLQINQALDQLRLRLKYKGVTIGAALISTLLLDNIIVAAPAALITELGKVLLVGGIKTTAAAGGISAGSTAALTGAKIIGGLAMTKITATTLAVVLGVGAFLIFNRDGDENTIEQKTVPQKNSSIAPPPIKTTTRDDHQPEPVEKEDEVSPEPEKKQEQPPAPTEQEKKEEPWLPVVMDPPPQVEPTKKDDIDLSSPESTVRSMIRMAVACNVEKVLACFWPDTLDPDIERIMNSQPGEPDHEQKVMMMSLDPSAEMPIIYLAEREDGLIDITWQVTFKKECLMERASFAPGDTMEIEGTVILIGDQWLIENM